MCGEGSEERPMKTGRQLFFRFETVDFWRSIAFVRSVRFDRFDAYLRIFKFKIAALDLIRASPPRNSLKKIVIIGTFGGSTAAVYSK
jgi:hypothetical protein